MRRRSRLASVPIEFYPRRFYFLAVQEQTPCSIYRIRNTDHDTTQGFERQFFPKVPGTHYISLEEQLGATSLNGDFVLGLRHTINFNAFLTNTLTSAQDEGRSTKGDFKSVQIFYLRKSHRWQEIQAIHLICRWRLLYLQLSPHDALAPFEHCSYLFSSYLSPLNMLEPPNLLHSLAGIAKGMEKELFGSSLESAFESTMSLSDNQLRFYKVSHRFLVFYSSHGNHKVLESGDVPPIDSSEQIERISSALNCQRVSLLITLDKSDNDFHVPSTNSRFEIVNLSGTTSFLSRDVVTRFLEICESSEGLIAVDGSSGSTCLSAIMCIGCYLMKHLTFTSDEVIGWLQFCLVLDIPLARKRFLSQMQSLMWVEGERFRQRNDVSLLHDSIAIRKSDSTHMKVGKMSLGRLSLLGVRYREKNLFESVNAINTLSDSLSSRTLEVQQSPTRATAIAQMKRRPLTQGSPGSRRHYRSTDSANVRADFALMHKYLHQTPPGPIRSVSNVTIPSLHTHGKISACASTGTSANCTEALA